MMVPTHDLTGIALTHAVARCDTRLFADAVDVPDEPVQSLTSPGTGQKGAAHEPRSQVS